MNESLFQREIPSCVGSRSRLTFVGVHRGNAGREHQWRIGWNLRLGMRKSKPAPVWLGSESQVR